MFYFIQAVFSGQDTVTGNPRIGLVLSGGGARGFAHIGVLKVLEEAGFSFDFIGGTSMGSIVGGLYASGYTAGEIESLTTEIDWKDLFNDEVKRRDLPFDERNYSGKYIGGLDFEGYKPVLPLGLIEGQRIEALLSRITWKSNTIEDFSDLPVSFICLAADVERSQAVVLNNGLLFEAMRASMAIPTVFTPVMIDRRLLVDGGTIRNFPVQDVRDLGADYIIGVDIGTPTKRLSDLRSAVDIINQVIGFRNTETNLEQRAMCDLLLTPDLQGYSSYDFSDPDSLVRLGEIGAREVFDRLEFVADSLRTGNDTVTRSVNFTEDSVFVEDIYVIGLREVTRNFVVSSFGHQTPGWLDAKKIDEGVERVYNTLFFRKVNYRIKTTDAAYVLVLIVEENKNDRINLGLRYDSYNNAQMLVNLTMRNFLVHSSKFVLDLKLGEDYSFGFNYYLFTTLGYVRNKTGIILSAGLDQKYFYLYHNGNRFAKLDFKSLYTSLSAGLTLYNNICMSAGVKFDFSSLKPSVAPIDFKNSKYGGFVYRGTLESDYLDRAYFTRSGFKTLFEIIVADKNFGSEENFIKLSADLSFFIPAAKRTVLFGGVWAGFSEADSLSVQNRYYTGGHKGTTCYNTFLGSENMELTGEQMAAFRAGIQLEPFDDRYIEFQFNAAKTAKETDEILIPENIYYGAGVTLGGNTPIGPVFLSIAGKDAENINLYINIGYDF